MYEHEPQTGAIIAAAIEVHRTLGPGFLEAVYQHSLNVEFELREIPYYAQFPLPVSYKGTKLECGYRVDFLCFGTVLVEIKAQVGLSDLDQAQVINYLRASDYERALLINLGQQRLQVRRQVLSDEYRAAATPDSL